MNVKEAIQTAKNYVVDLYDDEPVANLGLEEVEHDPVHGFWLITLAFSRPWNTPRTRAQEVLETMGGVSSLKRSFKVITVTEDGNVLSMKDRMRAERVE